MKNEKCILVLDETPENCKECQLCIDGMCIGKYKIPGRDIPSWCLLNPLPEKQMILHYPQYRENDYAEGWNDCLREITGAN